MWCPASIAEAAAGALRDAERRLRAEQAVHGLDAADEVELHPLLASGFDRAGFGVAREWPYPGPPGRRPRKTERDRCDIVLAPGPDAPLADPVARLLEQDALAGTLFERAPLAEPRRTEPEDAFWLEIKSVAQHAYVDGVPGPNRSYASQLVRAPLLDLAKLARERRVVFGGVLVVLFCEDERTAHHDLAVLAHRAIDTDLPLASPEVEPVPIEDRAGNGVCALALLTLRPAARQTADGDDAS